ncbi:cupin domain-containing protein [Spongiactinospora sp. 9N601]|uniref:cupin domain-containing protein n=1 Tax=Spongiactinospora sp. 9N601 TaxID=3375149 RepID=UPI0037B9A300
MANSDLVIGHRWQTEWTDDVDLLNLGEGVQVKIMYTDAEREIINMLIKFPPGYVEPAHTHESEHSSVVLEGVQIVDGRALHPGDCLHGPANVEHGPFSYPEGAVLFSVFRGGSTHHKVVEA